MTTLKRYHLQHAESRALRIVDAPDFHSACHAVGWYPAHVVLIRCTRLDDTATLDPCHANNEPAPAVK